MVEKTIKNMKIELPLLPNFISSQYSINTITAMNEDSDSVTDDEVMDISIDELTYTYYPDTCYCCHYHGHTDKDLSDREKRLYYNHNEEVREQKSIFDEGKIVVSASIDDIANSRNFLEFRDDENIILTKKINVITDVIYNHHKSHPTLRELALEEFSLDARGRTFIETETSIIITNYGKIGIFTTTHKCKDDSARGFSLKSFERKRNTSYKFECTFGYNILLNNECMSILYDLNIPLNLQDSSRLVHILRCLTTKKQKLSYETKCDYCYELLKSWDGSDKEVMYTIFDLCK